MRIHCSTLTPRNTCSNSSNSAICGSCSSYRRLKGQHSEEGQEEASVSRLPWLEKLGPWPVCLTSNRRATSIFKQVRILRNEKMKKNSGTAMAVGVAASKRDKWKITSATAWAPPWASSELSRTFLLTSWHVQRW